MVGRDSSEAGKNVLTRWQGAGKATKWDLICELRSDSGELTEIGAHDQRFCTSNQEAPENEYFLVTGDKFSRSVWEGQATPEGHFSSYFQWLSVSWTLLLPWSTRFLFQGSKHLGRNTMNRNNNNKKVTIRKNLMKSHAKAYQEGKLLPPLYMGRDVA